MELLEREDRELLARIGFFLCRDGVIPEAEAVFGGLATSAPERDGPVAGQALCKIIRGENDAALTMLNDRLGRGGSPIESALSLYKLLALGMAGKLPEAREFRRQMADKGMMAAMAAADAILKEMENRKTA